MRIIARADLSAEDGLRWADEMSVSLVEEAGRPLLFCLSASTPDRHRPGPDYSFVSYAPATLPEDPAAAAERVARAFDRSLSITPNDLTATVDGMRSEYQRSSLALRVSASAYKSGSRLDMHRRLSRIHALGPRAVRFCDYGHTALSTLAENPERRFQALVALGPFAALLLNREDLRAVVDEGLPLIPAVAERLGAAPGTLRKLIHARPLLDLRGITTTHYDWCRMARILSLGQNVNTPEGLAVLRTGFAVLAQRGPQGPVSREMRGTPARHWGRVARDCAATIASDADDYLYAVCVSLIERVWAPVMMARFAPLTTARAKAGDGAALNGLREAITGLRRGNGIERRARRVLEECARLRDLPGLSREWHAMILRESGFASREEGSWTPLLGTVRAGDHEVSEICSFEALERLGQEQQHCVTTRAPAVVSAHALRADIIFSIRLSGETVATAMISLKEGAWTVEEIRGPLNSQAPDDAVAAASSVLPLMARAWAERGQDYLTALRPAAALIRKHRAEDFDVIPDLETLRAILPESLRGLTPEEITDLINRVGPGPYEARDTKDLDGTTEQRQVEDALRAVETRTGRMEIDEDYSTH